MAAAHAPNMMTADVTSTAGLRKKYKKSTAVDDATRACWVLGALGDKPVLDALYPECHDYYDGAPDPYRVECHAYKACDLR